MRGLLKNQKLKWKDVVHFLPALLFFIDYTPFFFSSGDEKRQAIIANLQNLNHVLRYQESMFFPAWFHLWFRNSLIFFYWVLEVRMLIKIFRAESKEMITENKEWFRWLTIYVSSQFFLFAPFFLTLLNAPIPYWPAITLGTSIVLVFTAISLIFQPVILYGIRGWIIPPESLDVHPHQQGNTHMIYIGKEKLKAINKLLDNLMTTQKPYLKVGYSLIDLTNDLGVPLYQVSFFLNHEKGKNFHDMLNEYRIEHSRELMLNENTRQLTLEAIAFESGFGNRNSFTNAFKKFTGHTPSAFMKEIRQNGTNGNGTKIAKEEQKESWISRANGRNGNPDGHRNGQTDGHSMANRLGVPRVCPKEYNIPVNHFF
jgi:AraC-like DNA-binding protein